MGRGQDDVEAGDEAPIAGTAAPAADDRPLEGDRVTPVPEGDPGVRPGTHRLAEDDEVGERGRREVAVGAVAGGAGAALDEDAVDGDLAAEERD